MSINHCHFRQDFFQVNNAYDAYGLVSSRKTEEKIPKIQPTKVVLNIV